MVYFEHKKVLKRYLLVRCNCLQWEETLTRVRRACKDTAPGKSDLIDIDCIPDQSVEIDDTLVSFIDLSRFYRFHRFTSEDTSVLLFIQNDN